MNESRSESQRPQREDSGGLSPEVGADGTPRDRGQAAHEDVEATPGKGENQAGFLKEKSPPGEKS